MDPAYRRKVGVEFVKAMMEVVGTDQNGGSTHESDASSDDEDEDAVLEEMLDAEQQGYDEFEDDYDEIEEPDKDSAGGDDSEEEEVADEGALFGKRKAEDRSDDVANKKTKNS